MYKAVFKQTVFETIPKVVITYHHGESTRLPLLRDTDDFKTICNGDGTLRSDVIVVSVMILDGKSGNEVEEVKTIENFIHNLSVGDFMSINEKRAKVIDKVTLEDNSVIYYLSDSASRSKNYSFLEYEAGIKKKEILKILNIKY